MPDITNCPYCKKETYAGVDHCPHCELPLSGSKKKQVIVKTYKGKTKEQAIAAYQTDSTLMSEQGYSPTAQSWAPGQYGCGAFLLSLLLCFLIVGIIVFIYMLIVKPEGTLSVTYELRLPSVDPQKAIPVEEKTCPQCAEQVKAAALVCRFCSHNFE